MQKVNAHLFGTDVDLDNPADPRALSLRLIGASKRVLELGKTGEWIVRALQQQGCNVVAIEKERATCAALRKYCTSVICGDVQDLHLVQYLQGRKLDVLLLGSMLEWVPNPAGVLKKMMPFLREDGSVVATFANIAHASLRLALLDGRFEFQGGSLDADQLRFFTLSRVRRTFAEVGLEIKHVERIYQDPLQGDWEQESIPEAIKLLFARDPEAGVSQYVIKASPIAKEAARQLLAALDQEEADSSVQVLLSHEECEKIRQPELQALEARAMAEQDALELRAKLIRLEQESVSRLSQAEAVHRELEQQLQAAAQKMSQADARGVELARQLEGMEQKCGVQEQSSFQLQQRFDHEVQVRSKIQSDLEEQLESNSEQLLSSRREIRSLNEEKNQLVGLLQAHQQLLSDRAEELSQAKRSNDEQEELLEAQQEALEDLEWRLMSESRRRQGRDEQVRKMDAALREQEQVVTTLSGHIEDLEVWLDTKAREIEQQLTTIAKQRDDLAISEATVMELWQRLSWHKKELAQKNDLVGHQTLRITHMSHDLSVGSSEAQELRRLLNKRTEELEQKNDHLARQETRLLDLDRQREIAEATKEQLALAINELQAKEQQLIVSTEALRTAEAQLGETSRMMLEQEAQLLMARGGLEVKEDQYSSAALTLHVQEAQLAEMAHALRAEKINLAETDKALHAKEQIVSQQQERILQLEESLSHTGEEMDRAQRTLLTQLSGLGDQLSGTVQRLGERDGLVANLEETLAQVERDAHDLQFGLASHAEQLEQELGSLRASIAWRVVGHYEQAKEVLLPSGSRRRAAFDRMITYALGSHQRVLTA